MDFVSLIISLMKLEVLQSIIAVSNNLNLNIYRLTPLMQLICEIMKIQDKILGVSCILCKKNLTSLMFFYFCVFIASFNTVDKLVTSYSKTKV